jgi:hypothetical protein
MEHSGHGSPADAFYNVNLQADPAMPRAGDQVTLRIVVAEQAVGEPLDDFELLHDRVMHLIIVDQGLSHFAHVHPALNNGVFEVHHAFPEPGSYKLWSEAKPRGAAAILAAFRLEVGGSPLASPAADDIASGYRFELDHGGELRQHSPARLVFRVFRNESPVSDLEPLMAAGGHCVIISDDLRDFVHVHPEQDVASDWRGGPEVAFQTAFHRPGSYSVWGQFQHAGRVVTAAFRLHVAPAAGH